MPNPPENKLRYRLLTGPDDASFCQRVSEALEAGYELYGSPAMTFDGQSVIVAQAVAWFDEEDDWEDMDELMDEIMAPRM